MRFLVLQHVAVEHPGLFRDCMRAEGIAWDTVELDEGDALPAPDGYDALIVMGGPMDTWEEAEYPWLCDEKALIRHWVRDLERPFLGVCLGHQLLAAALGGTVARAARGEVGVLPVKLTEPGLAHPLLAGVDAQIAALQWHGAEVTVPPPGADVLAFSPDCAVQALALGRHAFSIQFHVEVIDTTVADWAAIPAYAESLAQALGRDGAATFETAAASHMQDFNALAQRLWRNWRDYAFS